MTMLSRATQRASHAVRTLARRSLASQYTSSSSVPTATPLATTPAPASAQSPNLSKTWSTSQRRRDDAYSEARFEQTALDFQPQPLSAMEMIHSEPIRMVHGRKAVCDGGASICLFSPLSTSLLSFESHTGIGPLGHPKVFINLVSALPFRTISVPVLNLHSYAGQTWPEGLWVRLSPLNSCSQRASCLLLPPPHI